MTLNKLYTIADKNNISVYHYPLFPLKSVSIPHSIGIDADTIHTTSEEKEVLAHELGHHMRNAFYKVNTSLDTKRRMEERATRWAVLTLIPADELKKALHEGCTEIYQLAERFDVSCEFMVEAIRIHKLKGNI